MLITVVLANYNHGTVINQAIECLNAQEIKPEKIIIIDDASTDKSLEIIKYLSVNHTNIKLIQNKENLGAIQSYNIGLREVKSEFVYFAAADDLTHPHLFSNGILALKINPNAAFVCMQAKIQEENVATLSSRPFINPKIKDQYINQKNVAKEFKKNDNWILTGTAIFRTKNILAEGGFDPALSATADGYIARSLAFRYGCVFIPYVGVTWRINQKGESRSVILGDSEKIVKKIQEKFTKDPFVPNWYAKKFVERWNFAFCRINLARKPLEFEFIKDSSLNQRISQIITQSHLSNRHKSLILLLYAFIKFRPFGVKKTAVALTSIKFEKLRTKTRIYFR